MKSLQEIQDEDNEIMVRLGGLYEEFARWEKQLDYDYKDKGDENGLSVLRNLPVDECLGAMRMWLEIATLKQRLVSLEAECVAWIEANATKAKLSPVFCVTQPRFMLGW